MNRFTLAAFFSLFILPGIVLAQDVRVGLSVGAASFVLDPGAVLLTSNRSSTPQTLTLSSKQTARASGAQLKIGAQAFDLPVTLQPKGKNGVLSINGKRYHGRLDVLWASGGVTLVNVLLLEDYIKGILPEEVPSSWPMETLKAQALAARSYALRNLGRHKSQGFDLCSQTHCQVYGGLSAEEERTTQAVEATRGLVLVSDGQLVHSVYHSSCGGVTDAAKDVWKGEGTGKPYLKSTRCPWCRHYPRFRWDFKIDHIQLAKKLKEGGQDVGDVKHIVILSRSPSQRVRSLRVIGSKGYVSLLGNEFRIMVNPFNLRSTLWTGVHERNGEWFFSGKGWGHGAGLCQWGAKGMADAGIGFERIVRYYYRGVRVQKWKA